MLTHSNLVSNVVATSSMVPVKPSYRLLSLLPLSHMLEQTAGLLIPLHHGASVVYSVSRQPSIIFKTMGVNHVTNAVLVPQVFGTFIDDVVGVRNRDIIGVENIMWSSDYPHVNSSWPSSREYIEKHFGDVPPEERRKMVHDNAAKLYGIG